MVFTGIRNSLANIDYSWNSPQTCVVLIPGLSLIVQKIQLEKLRPLISNKDVNLQNVVEANQKIRKFVNICVWHLGGAMAQAIACSIIVKTTAIPIFSFVGLLSIYEAASTYWRGWKQEPTIYQFNDQGQVIFKHQVFDPAPLNF